MSSPIMFDNLDYLAPTRTVTFTLTGVRTSTQPVTLELVYSGSGTTFFGEFAKLKNPGKDASLDDRAAYRERVARLFAQHGVSGWSEVFDAGAAVPFTPDACSKLFAKLIRLKDSRGETVGRWDLIDDAISYAMNPDNFTAPMVKADDLGKA